MNLTYKLKKSLFGFLQKYGIKTQTKIGLRLLLVFLAIWFLASVAIILSQWAYTDNFHGTPFQAKYLKFFWPVIIELVSGYDIDGAEFGLNPLSDVLSILVVITGVIIVAIFTAQVVSMFIRMMERINYLPEKPENFTFNRPVLICGVNSKLHNIIIGLRKSCLIKDREIVVIGSSADKVEVKDKKLYQDVWHVKGDRADRKLLETVLGKEETAAIILAPQTADESHGRYADARAIETAMAIEGYREQAHTVLELLDERNIPHLKHTLIDEWISIFDYGIRMVSQSALQHEMGDIYHYLLGRDSGDGSTVQIFFSQGLLPSVFDGSTYKEARNQILVEDDIDATLIGFARHVDPQLVKKCQINLGHLPFIKQLNPVSRRCHICGADINETDGLGRVQRTCPDCFEKEKYQNQQAQNPWFYPNDTRLNRYDKLIYLSHQPIDFSRIFEKKEKRRN
ncbi:MAG: hypothetical protein GY940_43255 [bacterium]|nr:hypothetical protein [bacterium]